MQAGSRVRGSHADHAGPKACPGSIFLWSIHQTRVAHPHPEVHVQKRFAAKLGLEPSAVSHIESGRRLMPAGLQPRWLQAIELNEKDLGHYLAAGRARSPEDHSYLRPSEHTAPETLLDNALHGGELTASQWAQACRAAAARPKMPMTQYDFCRLVIDTMATTHSEHHMEMASG